MGWVDGILGVLLGGCLVLLGHLLRENDKRKAFETLVKQRFFEAGINLDQRITTHVRMPEQWAETDGLNEEESDDLRGSTGMVRSRNTEWIDH